MFLNEYEQRFADELFAHKTTLDVGRKKCDRKLAHTFTHDTWNT